MSEALFERDLRAYLASQVPADVPPALIATVGALATRSPRSRTGRFPRMAGALVGVAAVILIGATVALSFANTVRPTTPNPGSIPGGTVWRTQMVTLEAREVSIDVGGKTFAMPADAAVHSDPGSATYRTLEMFWRDQGAEMRLFLYFAANDDRWWVTQIRTYDGRDPGEWIYYLGAGLRAPLGQPFAGDAEFAGVGFGGVGRLRMDDLRLTAFEPGTFPSLDRCRPAGNSGGAQSPNQDLSEFGVAPGMDAAEVGLRLGEQGICHVFRLEFPRLNRGQTWCTPPSGTVREFRFGSSGEILVFVEDGDFRDDDPNLAQVVGC